ncbi:transposase [Atopobium sp. oral taxon 416]|jgi:transposase|uniref:transposase n=1 Tax=Atopobium sp. oral taxon 416 TaxID=712157 RepID=UPI0020127A08|nr:transposase [Atopobium sp. oral taxon 416]
MLAELKTQCICLMDAHFPEYAGIFFDMFGAGSREVLCESPLPFELARRCACSLARNIAKASRRPGKSAEYAAEIKAAAKSSIGVRLGQQAASFQIKSLVRQIKFADSECAKVEARLQALLDKVEPLVLTISGVSYVTGAQIVSEIDDVSRFRNASALVSYAGLNSQVSQSGKLDSGGGPITKHGSPYLRRALWLAANRARQYDPGLRAFYDKKRAEGKP